MDVGFVVAFPLHHELDSEEVSMKDHVATLIAYIAMVGAYLCDKIPVQEL